MAFNPLGNFQKYKKIWMASMILVAMVTFVFCSGFGGSRDEGGLGGFITRLFRSRGDVYAEIDGSNYYVEEFRDMKLDRDIANKFMRHLLTLAKARAEEFYKLPEELKKQFGDRDIDKEDEADEDTLNRILWHAMRGEERYPGDSR